MKLPPEKTSSFVGCALGPGFSLIFHLFIKTLEKQWRLSQMFEDAEDAPGFSLPRPGHCGH